MNVKRICLAVGALTALGAAAPSFAQTVEIRISGASALQVSIRKTVAEVCDTTLPNSDRNYYISTTGETYTCTSRAAIFGGTARPVIIRKRDAGGSGLGVLPLNNPANTLGFTQAGGGTCASAGLVDLDPTAAVLNFNSFTGCSDTNLPVMYGVSDVEPRLFASQGPVNNVTGQVILGQIFGLALSNNIYNIIQAAQGGGVPNIRAVDYRAIVQGNYRDWSQVIGGPSRPIKVCRRVATSGTQQSSNVYFLANPCGAGAIPPASNTTDDFPGNDAAAQAGFIGNTGVYTVVMNSAAGNVDACLTAANAQGEFAIGVLGTERVPGASPSDDPDGVADSWQYARLNGFAPTVLNAIAGDYDFVFDATWNRGSGITYTAQQQQLANFFITTMGSPTTITAAGLLGVAALPDNGFDPTSQSPVLFGSHAGNSCSPILNVFP